MADLFRLELTLTRRRAASLRRWARFCCTSAWLLLLLAGLELRVRRVRVERVLCGRRCAQAPCGRRRVMLARIAPTLSTATVGMSVARVTPRGTASRNRSVSVAGVIVVLAGMKTSIVRLSLTRVQGLFLLSRRRQPWTPSMR